MPYHRKSRRTNRRPAYRKRRRTGRKGRRKGTKALRPKVMRLSRQVRKLAAVQEGTMSHMTFVDSDYGRIVSVANNTSASSYSWMSLSAIDLGIAQLRYFNPSFPDVPITVDYSGNAFQKEIRLSRCYNTITVKANYLVAVRFEIYLCVCVADTNQTVVTSFIQGVPLASNSTFASDLINPWDSILLTDMWKTTKLKSGTLLPGHSVTCSHRMPGAFSYDPTLSAIHTSNFQKRNKSFAFLLRTSGTLAHDSVDTGQQGYQSSICDVKTVHGFRVTYDGGADTHWKVVSDGVQAMTTADAALNQRESVYQFPAII